LATMWTAETEPSCPPFHVPAPTCAAPVGFICRMAAPTHADPRVSMVEGQRSPAVARSGDLQVAMARRSRAARAWAVLRTAMATFRSPLLGPPTSQRRRTRLLGLAPRVLGEPLGDVGVLDDLLLVDLPAPVFLHQRVQLVLNDAELVEKLVLRVEHVGDVCLVALDLARVDLELEDLHLGHLHDP